MKAHTLWATSSVREAALWLKEGAVLTCTSLCLVVKWLKFLRPDSPMLVLCGFYQGNKTVVHVYPENKYIFFSFHKKEKKPVFEEGNMCVKKVCQLLGRYFHALKLCMLFTSVR